MRALIVPLLLAMVTSPAGAAETSSEAQPFGAATVRMLEPRSYGYFVGDVFRRVAEIDVQPSFRLEPSSLPAPGRLNYWLDLKAVGISEATAEGVGRYRIDLDYQNFYVPLQPTRLAVPGATISFTDGKTTIEADIPAWSFVGAALREIAPEKPAEGPAGYLQPDATPRFIPTGRPRAILAMALGSLAVFLTLLAHHMAWGPFRARPQRPFTSAARAIKSRFAGARNDEAYRASLLDLHRAFDQSAGRRVLAEDVPDFIRGHQAFQPFNTEITRFFAASRRAFFGNDVDGAAKSMPAQDVALLGAKLGEAERGTA